ncbi:hypothetical protein GS991_21910, partial [Roseobacter sp. HKCCD8193]|uniref:hypothetical protein n=1 Tax=Roseobacter sp. HKCCD8193 TaxID=2690668 RepID=UPI0014918C37
VSSRNFGSVRRYIETVVIQLRRTTPVLDICIGAPMVGATLPDEIVGLRLSDGVFQLAQGRGRPKPCIRDRQTISAAIIAPKAIGGQNAGQISDGLPQFPKITNDLIQPNAILEEIQVDQQKRPTTCAKLVCERSERSVAVIAYVHIITQSSKLTRELSRDRCVRVGNHKAALDGKSVLATQDMAPVRRGDIGALADTRIALFTRC